MNKLFLGIGYLTWTICNITIIYWVGVGVMKLIESQSVGVFLKNLSIGLVMLSLISICSILILTLITYVFGDEKGMKKIEKTFPFLTKL